MARLLTFIVAFASAASTMGPVAAEVVHHPEYTVDSRGDVTIILWLSEGVLNASEPPEGLPGEWWPMAERWRASLANRPSHRSADTACLPLPQGEAVFLASPEDERASPTDYATFLGSSGLVVVADVQAVEPGLLVFGGGGIAQRVRVSVVEVLRDTGGSVAPGDELTSIGQGGSLHFGGETVCALEHPDQEIPKPGTRVILSASLPGPASGTFVNASTVFPVLEDTIVLPPGTRFEDREVGLEELRGAMLLVEEEAEQ